MVWGEAEEGVHVGTAELDAGTTGGVGGLDCMAMPIWPQAATTCITMLNHRPAPFCLELAAKCNMVCKNKLVKPHKRFRSQGHKNNGLPFVVMLA